MRRLSKKRRCVICDTAIMGKCVRLWIPLIWIIAYTTLFSALDLEIPRAATGRKGFPKEAMLCAFLVIKCEGFSQISDLADYLENNRLIAHYCGFDIMKPLPSYWTYDRFLRNLSNDQLKGLMAVQVKKLYELGVVDASFIGLDSTPVCANTRQNNPKSFVKNKFSKETQKRPGLRTGRPFRVQSAR